MQRPVFRRSHRYLISACLLVTLGLGLGLAVHRRGPRAGAERGPCYGNGTCNAGLSCLSRVCVIAPGLSTVAVEVAGKPIVTAEQVVRDVCACMDLACAQATLRRANLDVAEKDRETLDRALQSSAVRKQLNDCLMPMTPGIGRTEAMLQLAKMGKNAKRAFAETSHYPTGEVSLTPATPCCQQPDHRCPSTPSDWDHPIWKALDYQRDDPGWFRYSYESDGKSFTAKAVGNPDCRAEPLTFVLTGTSERGHLSINLTEPP